MLSITFLDFVIASMAESDSYKDHARIRERERGRKEVGERRTSRYNSTYKKNSHIKYRYGLP